MEKALAALGLHPLLVLAALVILAMLVPGVGKFLTDRTAETLDAHVTGVNLRRAAVLVCLSLPILSLVAQYWSWQNTDLFSPIVPQEPVHPFGRTWMRRSDWTTLMAMQFLLAVPSAMWMMGERSRVVSGFLPLMGLGWIGGLGWVTTAAIVCPAMIATQVPPAMFSAAWAAWWFSVVFAYAILAAGLLALAAVTGSWLWSKTA